MKKGRLTLLSVAIVCSLVCCLGGVYEPIASGGPDGKGGKYSLTPGLPDPTTCEVCLEGHIYEFKGQLILDEPDELDQYDEWAEYTFWFADPARILVQNTSDVNCIMGRGDPPTCYVEEGAYLVTEDGDLIYVKDVRIRPDNDMAVPAWQYLGTGYLTKDSSDPDSTTNDSSNLTGSIANLTENARRLDEGIAAAVANANGLRTDMNASNATIDANLIGKVDSLSRSLDNLKSISDRLVSDLGQSGSESEALTRWIEGSDLTATTTEPVRDLNEIPPECRHELKWSGPEINCSSVEGPGI